MSRILGRADDMLIIRGVNVFPSQVESALIGLHNIAPHYALVLTREDHLDSMEVQVEVTDGFYGHIGEDIANSNEAAALAQQVHHTLRNTLGLNTQVSLLAPGQAPRSEGGKLKRVIDKRVIK